MILTKIWFVKSVRLKLFSLLGSSSSSSVYASSFECVVIWFPYLTLNFVISSLIVGTFTSACMTLLGIYHGEFTVAWRTLFWYLCNISMLELLAVPHRGISYVHLYLTTHNSHDRQESMPPAVFEPTIPGIERPQTHILDRAAIGRGV